MTQREANVGSNYPTPYNAENETCERTCATLRLFGGDITPMEVTSKLRLEPSSVTIAGRIVQSTTSKFSRTERLNAWFLSSEDFVHSKDVRDHLDWLIEVLRDRQRELKELRENLSVAPSVVCIWWSAAGGGGPTLWPAQMQALSDLDLECSFEFAYFEAQGG